MTNRVATGASGGWLRSLGATLSRLRTEARKKLMAKHSAAELAEALVARPRHFRSPPFTPELLAAVRRITPQFHLVEDEASRELWELSQNGSCWGEMEALEPLLEALGEPSKVLEIGPGMGRSAVFLKRALDWHEVPFHLYEGEGRATKYTADGPRRDDSFCGDITSLRQVLEFNGVEQVEVFDAAALDYRLEGLPGPYDLIYSFYGVGYHWSLGEFLDEILGLMDERSVGLFTVHKKFRPFPELDRLAHRFVTYRRVIPKHRVSRLMVLCKSRDRLAELMPAG